MVKHFQAIIIALCSTFLFVSVVIFLLTLMVRRWRKNAVVVDDQIAFVVDQSLTPVANKEITWLDSSLQISIRDIAYNKMIIDKTSFATVHKAKLKGGLNLTVKRLIADSCRGFTEFRSELEILRNLRHPNIVRMRGYCFSSKGKFLIYNFFERGSLDTCLREKNILSWEARVKIVRGVADGLAFMHGSVPTILHRSVNPKSILLGPNFEAHIDDFGLARLVEVLKTHVSTDPVGPQSYSPPEYFTSRSAATTKGDVYGFGVLMLAAVSRDWHVDETRGLVKWAQDMVNGNRELEMLDLSNFKSSISGEALDEASVKGYFRVALRCVNYYPKLRPTMMEVVELLKEL